MNEESTTTTETAVETTVETPAERQVPYDRFKKVNDSKKEIEGKLADAQRALEERETQDMGEVDKLRRAVEKAEERAKLLEQKATENEERATNLERSGWVRAEATKVGFTDPEDAVAFVALSDIEDQGKASKAVADLAKRKAHLIAKKEDGAPGLSKILDNGEVQTERTDPKANQATAEAQMLVDGLKQFVQPKT